jgi:hypothetical protein
VAQLRLVAPAFVRFELSITPDGVDLQVWEVDDKRYISSLQHCTTYPSCSVGEALDVLAATLDSLGLPDGP